MRKLLGKRLGPDRESGAALILVIGIGMALLILVTTTLSFSLSGVVKAKSDQDWNAAMSAAYAGVEEYESRLANDNTYQQYGNRAAAFSSASSLTLPGGADANPAFGVGTSGTWAPVSGSGGTASYRYEVDNSQYADTGVIRIRSTGRVGGATRSIVANLKQKGFIDFLYFTDYEIQDPDQSGAPVGTCVKHAWEGRPSSGCSEIAFGGGDVINGPMHSNDTIRICDAKFLGPVTTAYNPPSGLRYTPTDSNGYSCGGQRFNVGGGPSYSPSVNMPPTNSEMRKETRSDLSVEVPRPGCLYTGPTSIRFNRDGTMTVRSPWTKATRVAGEPPTSGTQPAACGRVGTGENQLGSEEGQTLRVPASNLIYVQNVPVGPSDPNYWPASGPASQPRGYEDSTCSSGNGIGFPAEGEYVSSIPTSYGCRNGDVFVQGTLHAATTVASENYVYVTGDVKYQDAQTDVLGLVGNNAVFVWNPIKADGSSILRNDGRRIDAAILSLTHTFQVQNYNSGGERGTLTVNGAIGQKFRGIVHSGGNGYYKNYVYDPRLRYIAPPKFLSPVSTSYGVSVLVEVKAAFKPDGGPTP